jgi:hypothetical protein
VREHDGNQADEDVSCHDEEHEHVQQISDGLAHRHVCHEVCEAQAHRQEEEVRELVQVVQHHVVRLVIGTSQGDYHVVQDRSQKQ